MARQVIRGFQRMLDRMFRRSWGRPPDNWMLQQELDTHLEWRLLRSYHSGTRAPDLSATTVQSAGALRQARASGEVPSYLEQRDDVSAALTAQLMAALDALAAGPAASGPPRLRVLPSRVAGAGLGVLLEGRAQAGQLLGVCSGAVLTHSDAAVTRARQVAKTLQFCLIVSEG